MSRAIVDPSAHETPPSRGAGDADRPLHVLVVEDDEDTAASLTLLLGLYGHAVQAAPDGPTALRMAQARPPDVVLLDIGLPGMNGYEVARQLRQQAAEPLPLLVATTGYGQEADQRRSQ